MKKPVKQKKPVYKFSTVMLVDDNDLDNFINQKILESNFFAENIYINTGGVSAIEFLKNFSANKKIGKDLIPDVIFVDINMPFMDGFQFLDQLFKLSEKIVGTCKLVVLTSSINIEDKNKVSKLSPEIIFLNKPLTDKSLSLII